MDAAHESIGQRLRLAGMNVLTHGWRISQRDPTVDQPGLDGLTVLQWNQMPIAQLATGVPKTLGGLNEITQADEGCDFRFLATHAPNPEPDIF